jgi:ABC-type bacteriocin/lantibiotic exporter with double-glycine peptidase domain
MNIYKIKNKRCVLALDEVWDPQNFGALLRTAFFLGFIIIIFFYIMYICFVVFTSTKIFTVLLLIISHFYKKK